jgi:hypothetical protein
MPMKHQDLSRRRFLAGSSAAVGGALLMPGGWPATARPPRRALIAATTPAIGATVNPSAYHLTNWLQAAQTFDSYVSLPLATTAQKIFLNEGQYYSAPLPAHITGLATAGCQFIVCVYPSRTTDDSANLAAFLQLLNSNGIVYQVALVNEWNAGTKFVDAQHYTAYWNHYAPVVQAAGVPCGVLVCASSNKAQYAKIQPGFPVNPLPDRYWIDFYAQGYRYNVRLDTPGGLLDQAASLGVPVGIAEFGIGAGFAPPLSVWEAFCPYLVSLAPRLPLGCLYWGCQGQDIVTGPTDPKVPGIQQVIAAFP